MFPIVVTLDARLLSSDLSIEFPVRTHILPGPGPGADQASGPGPGPGLGPGPRLGHDMPQVLGSSALERMPGQARPARDTRVA